MGATAPTSRSTVKARRCEFFRKLAHLWLLILPPRRHPIGG